MKSIIALFLISFVGFAFSQSQNVDPGYKSSSLNIEDNETGYFRIPIDGKNSGFCNPGNDTSIICGVKVIYDKSSGGEQRICVGWEQLSECTTSSADYVETLGLEDVSTYTYYAEYDGGADWSGDLYLTIGGKCKTSDLCLETTDGDIEGVRIYEALGSSNMGDVTDNSGYTNTYYVPFEMDTDGSNTAMYTVNAGQTDDFAYPSMVFDIASGGEDHYIVLDIDELNDISYSVEFHYTDTGICGDSSVANSTLCQFNVTGNYVYPEENTEDPFRGSYATGPVSLPAGEWGVTPYVYSDNVQSALNFRFCGAVGYECASASGLAPSIALFVTLLLAIIAYLF